MKLRYLLVALFVGMVTSLYAQTHKEAIEYYKTDQYNNAYELLNRNLNNAETDKAQSYYYLGQIEFYRGKNADAKKDFESGIAADPNSPYCYVGLGYMALKSGDVKGAEKYFKEAESKAKKDQSVMMEIARAYYNTDKVGYKDKYEKYITNALKKDVKNPDIYILQGDILRDEAYASENSKTYGLAAAKYDMATTYDPTSAVAYVKYANMYNNANNPQFAIQKLEELVKNNPNSALGQRQLAIAYYDNEQYTKAANQYGQYVKNPNHFKTDEYQYSNLLYYDKRYKDGYDYATTLITQDPTNFAAQIYQFMNASKLPEMEGNMINLADKLQASHTKNKDNQYSSAVYVVLADTYKNANRKDDAKNLLAEAIEVYPNDPSFNQALYTMQIEDERYDLATDEYARYLDKLSKPTETDYTTLGLYAFNGGRQYLQDFTDKNSGQLIPKDQATADKYFNIAKTSLQKAIEINPTYVMPYKLIGDVERAMDPANDATAAFDSYSKGIELFEANPYDSYNGMARLMYNYLANYYNGKDNAKAQEYLSKANALQ